jgi:acyl CoA:acetate/3-ketoacid CoA transferase alpha subunit
VRKMISSYIGENKLFEQRYLSGELERVDIQGSCGLENLIQAPFRTGALNVGGSSGSARPSVGTDGAVFAG